MGALFIKAPPADDRIQRVVDALQLSKRNLAAMYRVFRRYDRDRSGTIDYEEFYKLIGEKQNVFGDSIFELVDLDNNGTLDFGEFVEATTTYNMFGKEDVLKFCFYIFDKDKNGFIEDEELQDLVSILHGTGANANIIRALKEFDHDKDNKITFKEFVEMNEVYPGVLFPAFRIQSNMQQRIMGFEFWAAKRRKFKNYRAKEAKEAAFEAGADERAERKARLAQVRARVGALKFYMMPFNHDMWLSMLEEEEKERQEKADRERNKRRKKKKSKFEKGQLAAAEATRKRVKVTPANPSQKLEYEKEERVYRRERKRDEEYGGRTRRSKRRKKRLGNNNRMRRRQMDAWA
jgi:sphingosine kinase/serine/threonine-protein phosphatase 2B regulatory subunit